MAKQQASHTNSRMLIVQSVVCGVLVLTALLFRLIGGGWYEQWRAILRDSMTDLSFVETLAEVWEEGAATRA